MVANEAPHDEASYHFLSCDSWNNLLQPHWSSLCSLNTFLSDILQGYSFTSFEYCQIFSHPRGFSVFFFLLLPCSPFLFVSHFVYSLGSGDGGPQDFTYANLSIFFKTASSSLHSITLYHPYPLLFHFIAWIIIFCLPLTGI